MKFNLKAFIALIVIVGTIFWAVNSLRANSYNGSNLTFNVGGGAITITNPSTETIPVQLVSTRSTMFSVSSETEGVTGRSIRQGSGRGATQLYEFGLPPGVTELTVGRNADVSFVSNSDTRLEATVQESNTDQVSTILIVTGVVVLGGLYYISHTYEHQWLRRLRGQKQYVPVVKPVNEEGGQGKALKAYGDNRTSL